VHRNTRPLPCPLQATAPRRKTTAAAPAPMLTQAELLAEAAYTELDNLASLQLLMAQEEESKKRAMVVKKKYGGPSLKYKSRRVDEEALVGGVGLGLLSLSLSGYVEFV
jgi:hypothetical protein